MSQVFHTPSEITLEWPGLENIRQVPPNGAKDAQNHDARNAVSATLQVLKWSGAIFGLDARDRRVRSFYHCPFHWKLRPSGVSLESPRLENITQDRLNRAKIAQNQDAREAVSANL